MTDFFELNGYPRERHTLTEFQGTRKGTCAWTDRYAVLAEILGTNASWPYRSTNGICTEAVIEPHSGKLSEGATADLAAYEKAVITFSYKSPGFGDRIPIEFQGELISEEILPFTEFLTIDYTLVKWSSGDSLKEQEAPGRQLKGFVWNYTRHEVGFPVPSAVLSLVGKVNDTPVLAPTLGLQFPAQTLLYNDPRIARLSGNSARVQLAFTHRPQGWNTFWRVETQQFETMQTIAGTPYDNYEGGNFSQLFL